MFTPIEVTLFWQMRDLHSSMKFGFRALGGIRCEISCFCSSRKHFVQAQTFPHNTLLSSREVTRHFKRMKNGQGRMECEQPKWLLLFVMIRCYGDITALFWLGIEWLNITKKAIRSCFKERHGSLHKQACNNPHVSLAAGYASFKVCSPTSVAAQHSLCTWRTFQ